MPIQSIRKELKRIGQLLNCWQAELWAAAWGAMAVGILWAAGLADIFLHLGHVGRIVAWAFTLSAFGIGMWRVRKALSTTQSLESVAARIEQVFPELDNRLINVLQFSLDASADPMVATYIKQGVPNWNKICVSKLRESPHHRRAYLALAVAVALLAAPFFWMSESWSNALARILNPFTSRPASTLARISAVIPGNIEVIGGAIQAIRAVAIGKAGQPVSINLWPLDDHPSNIVIGKLSGGGPEEFSYQISKVTAPLDYQMQAGDAMSERFHVAMLLPLSIKKLEVTVTPRKEMGRPPRKLNGLTEQIMVPYGAGLGVNLTYNRPVAQAFMVSSTGISVPLIASADGMQWKGAQPVDNEGTVLVIGCAANDEKLTTSLKVSIEPDRAPTIKIIAPAGNVSLAAGSVPSIQWEAADDFGLSKVFVEEVLLENAKPDETTDVAGTVLQEWPAPDGATSLAGIWKGDVLPKADHPVGFRVVAIDNYGPGAAHMTRSPVYVFQIAGAKKIAEAAKNRASETEATLAKLVAAQTKALATAEQFAATLSAVKPEQWDEQQESQKEIRKITGVLLADPKKPLATLREKVMVLYQEQMQQVITALQALPTADAAAQPAQAARVVRLQTWILHVLSGVQAMMPGIEKDKQITDLLTIMDLIVKGEAELVGSTKAEASPTQKAGGALAKKQDRLAGDADQFVAAAKDSAADLKGTDAVFSELLAKVASEMVARKVSADMLLASEQLDAKNPKRALPFEESALNNLRELQAMLDSWRVDQAEKTQDELVAELRKDGNKMEKLRDMQKKVIESMRAMKPTEDKTTEREDDVKRELAEKQKALEVALLKVATDLHIFPDANIGNEVAQEVVTRVTNIKQAKGSEHAPALERALQKEDWILKDMDKVAARIKDGLAYLMDTPNNVNAITENFDKQEMKAMAMVPLDNKVEDLIGELLKQDADIAEKTKSSATNQAMKDAAMEGPVAEGEWANYSAKGKSGNTEPKHNEQAGRSNVGRQGQSNGETAAAAGKINKGDDKLENRMTQDAAQSGEMGKVDDSEAKAVSSGGGKLSGTAEDVGMAGQGPRRDAKDTRGSALGEQALMRQRAEVIYAAASKQHVRTGSLDVAIRHMRETEEAIREARPIEQIRDYRKLASEALRKTQSELAVGSAGETIDSGAEAPKPAPDRVAGAADEAPAAYQSMVSDYYKAISSTPH